MDLARSFRPTTQPTPPSSARIDTARADARIDGARSDVKARTIPRDPSHDADMRAVDVDVRKAYERGRRDERARQSRRHRGSPVLTLLLLLAAGAGATVIWLGVREGSFERGGQLVDQNISNTTATATATTRSAADKAAAALQNAGQGIKQAAGG